MSPFRSSFLGNIPPVVKNLMIINLLFWLASVTLPRMTGIDLDDWLALHYWGASHFYPYQLVSCIFMHASFEHLFFNMLGLFMFGSIIEQTWGPKRFLTYYVVTGIGASIVQLLIFHFQIQAVAQTLPSETVALIKSEGWDLLNQGKNYIDPVWRKLNLMINIMQAKGASGAIFGLLLAFGMMFPNMPMFIMFIPIPIKAKYCVIGYGLLELFFGVASFGGDNVAHFAHLGGMLFGYLLIRKWRKTNFNM